MFNNLNFLFLFMTFFSTMVAISSTSWIGAWMGLEINMISFIPLIINSKNIVSNESALKYFLIQAVASASFISMCLLNSFSFYNLSDFSTSIFYNFVFSLPLIMKLGGAPFQTWFLMVMEGLNWFKCFILMTWQKIAPLFLMFYFSKAQNIIIIFASLSLLIGSIGGLNQTSLKKIMAYSSINHIGWLLTSMMINKQMLIMYICFYILLNSMVMFFFNNNMNNFMQIFNLSQPMLFSFTFLSLGGLPPLLGFLPKWLVIQNMTNSGSYLLVFIMVMTALITLFFYTRLIYTNLILSNSLPKWQIIMSTYPTSIFTKSVIFILSLFGLILFNIFFY